MKKFVSFLAVFVALFVFVVPTVKADSAISANEQQILTALKSGVTVGGKTFNLDASQLTQAENYLKQNDLTADEVSKVVASIESAKALVAGQNIDVTNINSLTDLLKALPASVKDQIRAHVTTAANVLGLTVSLTGVNGLVIADKAGNTAFSAETPVKNTGVSYLASVATVGALIAIAAGAYVVGRKPQVA